MRGGRAGGGDRGGQSTQVLVSDYVFVWERYTCMSLVVDYL